MYSAHSPTLSSTFGDQFNAYATNSAHHHLHLANHHHQNHLGNYSSSFSQTNGGGGGAGSPANMSPSTTTTSLNHHFQQQQQKASVQCIRFKYFTTFFVCTTCLALLSASLATHKWLVSKPQRLLRLNNGQTTNFTALMLTASLDEPKTATLERRSGSMASRLQSSSSSASHHQHQSTSSLVDTFAISTLLNGGNSNGQQQQNNKFQGEIYFGLFNGVKVLNYGFGDRVSQLSVVQSSFQQPRETSGGGNSQYELVNSKFWLATLLGVIMAILFALIGSIFAIINFVMTPRGTISGPVGLVIWNAAACFSCLLAMFAWLVEYFMRLKANVLTPEEVQNGWTSENRSQFGYSYYFVVLAFVLHLVNIFIVSIVQSETWTNGGTKSSKRGQSRSACDGVIMLY